MEEQIAIPHDVYRRYKQQISPSPSPPQRRGVLQSNDSRPLDHVSPPSAMTQPTPTSSRKRSLSDGKVEPEQSHTFEGKLKKRQRTLTPSGPTSPPGLRLLIPGKDIPPTPTSSVASPATITLKLIVPREQLTYEQQRIITRHRQDAERWKPKLQRPYPTRSEIKAAYQLKLMRHYHNSTVLMEPNFEKPRIEKSLRVSHLLQHFPLTQTMHPIDGLHMQQSLKPTTPTDSAIPLTTRMKHLKHAELTHPELQANIHSTSSDHAQQLAWQSFSAPEQRLDDRGREAMVLSGLFSEDLLREGMGLHNGLPDWKKTRTGRFAGTY